MLTLQYFLSPNAEWLFGGVAEMNEPGVADSFHSALQHTRKHIVEAVRNARTLDHHNLCYNFQACSSLLMATLDGMAVYVEKCIASPANSGRIYWADERAVFVDPRFQALKEIRDRTNGYIIKGGVDAHALRNFSKHYLPWLDVISKDPVTNEDDILFYIDRKKGIRTGPCRWGRGRAQQQPTTAGGRQGRAVAGSVAPEDACAPARSRHFQFAVLLLARGGRVGWPASGSTSTCHGRPVKIVSVRQGARHNTQNI